MNEPLEPNPEPTPRSFRETARQALALLRQEGFAFLVLGGLLLLFAATWFAITRTADGWVTGLAIGGLISIAVYVALCPQDVRRILGGRTVRYGSNVVLVSVAVTGIVILLNYLSNRYYKRFDVTEGNLHSLSEQSIQIVQGLEQPIEVIGVYPGGQGQESFEKWLDEYNAYTDQLAYRTIDPLRQPGEADQLGWTAYGGGLLLRRGSRTETVRSPDEQDITSGLLKVSRDSQKTVYFLTGHGEPSPTGFEGDDYGQIGTLLQESNYAVETLNLAITDTVPADAAVVVVAGLKTPLLEGEVASLRQYLLDGGKALLLIDPGLESGINDVLAPWQVRIENKLIVDLQRSLSGDAVTPIADRYQFSQITKDLPMVAFPLACPIVWDETADESPFTPLAQTSERAWADVDMSEETTLAFDEGIDLPGPLTLLGSIEAPSVQGDSQTRVVIAGDADLATNGVLEQIPNGQFLVSNAVNWLAEEEDLIAIGPKNNVPRSVNMTGIQEGVVCFGTLVFIPGVILLAGFAVWLRRR